MIAVPSKEAVRIPHVTLGHGDGSKPNACDRLDSWKEIAAYLRRSVRCVQRWERTEGLPVLRHRHAKGATVYAYRCEVDEWWHDNGISAQAPYPRGTASGTHNIDISPRGSSSSVALRS